MFFVIFGERRFTHGKPSSMVEKKVNFRGGNHPDGILEKMALP